ncbi:MAG: ABC transporter permease [Actinomycetia bacterium]|nr:ABC transporter permease [Actinomycetes bacterium]
MSAPMLESAPERMRSGSRVPLTRLINVELRKSYDTLAGRWLLIAIAAITAVVLLIFFLNADADERTFQNFMGITGTPQAILLPVLGVLLITSEWSQRTALVTFTMSPSRSKVLISKVIAALMLGFAAVIVAVLFGSAFTAIGGSDDPWTSSGDIGLGTMIAHFGLFQIINVMWGIGFGLLLLNSAAAIVAFFAVPIVISVLSNVWSAMDDIGPWIDLSMSSQYLFDPDGMTSTEWQHLLVGVLIWLGIPLVIGTIRLLRSEVK